MKLVLGNKNYSSWSLRPWLLMDAFNLDFQVIDVSLHLEGLGERLGEFSGTKKVPVLIDEDLTVWDSLAICEYVSENYLNGKGWPELKEDKAIARAISSEMHSGLFAIRNEMPMNCRARRKITLSEEAKKEVARIDSIWTSYARETQDGNSRLFGQFTIADCFFAPVAFRFQTYGIKISEKATKYMNGLLNHPSMKKWYAMAEVEEEIIERAEIGEQI